MKRRLDHPKTLRPLASALRAALIVIGAGSAANAAAQLAPLAPVELAAGRLAALFASELPAGSRIVIDVDAARAPADGRSTLRVDIALFDAAGAPLQTPARLRLSTSLGRLQAADAAALLALSLLDLTTPGPNAPWASALELRVENGRATVLLQAPAAPGPARLQAASGAVRVDGTIEFVRDLRPLLAVGILEGVLKRGRLQRDPNAPALVDGGIEDSLRRWQRSNADGQQLFGARAAFYAKGAVAGDVLVTASADSDKPTRGKLFRDLDPNQFYPVYGDASTREYDARSSGRLYVRVEHEASHLLLGDFTTATDNPAQRLASHQRSLNGLRGHLERSALRANAWAAHGRQRQFVDEMPGRGTSGPYAIGQPDALANSEQVELLVRDRSQPAVVLHRRTLTRFVDYDFEPFSGRLVFRQPVPSVDAALNPVSIRISYEVDGSGARFWTFGADATLKVAEGATLGAAYAQDDNPLAPYRLSGVNAAIALGPRTQLVAEVAASRGTSFYNQDAAALAALGNGAVSRSGQAGRVELRHQDDALQMQASVARAGAGFQNSQGGLASGRQEIGLRTSYALSPALRLRADATQTQDRSGGPTDGAQRRAYGAGAEWTIAPTLRAEIGLNRVEERQVGGSGGFLSAAEAQADASSVGGLGTTRWSGFGFGPGGSLASPVTLATPSTGTPPIERDYTSVRLRLTSQLTPALALFAEHERADADRQRSALGADYRLGVATRLYARHEFANSLTGPTGLASDGRRTETTAVGIDTAYMEGGQVFSELRSAGHADGRDAYAAAGVRNRFQIAPGLAVTTAFERQQSRPAASAVLDATALALGAEYSANPIYRVGAKLEGRHGTLQDSTLVSLGIDRKLADDWTAVLRTLRLAQHGRAGALGNDETQARYQLGLAYRESDRQRWNGLARIERRIDERTLGAAAGGEADASKSWVASLHANLQASRTLTHAAQLGWKAVDQHTGTGAVPGASHWHGALAGWRTTFDIGERWDASLYGSVQQAEHARLHGVGVEAGYRLLDNLWLSAGYTAGRHSDADMFAANTRWNGAHLRLRFKFDEALLALKP